MPSTRIPGKPKPRARCHRGAGLLLVGLGDRPLVVLAEEHDRAVVDAGEHQRLRDVALRGGAVAEVRDDGGVPAVVAGADVTVALDAHRVARRVEGLGADDDRVEVEVLLVRVPPAVVHPTEHPEQVDRVDPAAPGDAVLAVGGEGVVLATHRPAGPHLRGLLAEQAGPQAELTLALERGGLGVEAPDEDEVAVEPAQRLVGEIVDQSVELGVRDALPLRAEQLDHVGPTLVGGTLGGDRDAHVVVDAEGGLEGGDLVVAHRALLLRAPGEGPFSGHRDQTARCGSGHGRVSGATVPVERQAAARSPRPPGPTGESSPPGDGHSASPCPLR